MRALVFGVIRYVGCRCILDEALRRGGPSISSVATDLNNWVGLLKSWMRMDRGVKMNFEG